MIPILVAFTNAVRSLTKWAKCASVLQVHIWQFCWLKTWVSQASANEWVLPLIVYLISAAVLYIPVCPSQLLDATITICDYIQRTIHSPKHFLYYILYSSNTPKWFVSELTCFSLQNENWGSGNLNFPEGRKSIIGKTRLIARSHPKPVVYTIVVYVPSMIIP